MLGNLEHRGKLDLFPLVKQIMTCSWQGKGERKKKKQSCAILLLGALEKSDTHREAGEGQRSQIMGTLRYSGSE